MKKPASEEYVEAQILTAPREKLLLMLLDGALGFCHRARKAWETQDVEGCHQALIRSQRIILELKMSLNRALDPKIYEGLQSLYAFVYRRLVEANVQQDMALVEEAVTIIRDIKTLFDEDLQRVQQEERSSPSSVSPKKAEMSPSWSSVLPVPTVNLQG